MRLEDLVAPIPFLKFQHADFAIAGCAGEQAPGFVVGPADNVHGGGVQGEVSDAGPLALGFAPDEDFAVVGGGGEDVAVLGVGLLEGKRKGVSVLGFARRAGMRNCRGGGGA